MAPSRFRTMYPIIDIPALGLAIPIYNFMLALAVAVGLVWGPISIARREGLDPSRVRRALLTLALMPFLTGRLHFLYNYPDFYSAHPLRAFLPWGGAIHVSGALTGLLIGVPLVAWWYKLPAAKMGDGLVPVVALAVAIFRVECLLYGCCYGSPCHYPWCISYPSGSVPFLSHLQAGLIAAGAPRSLPVHPEPIYFMLSALLTLVVTVNVERRKRYDGQVVWVAMIVLFGTNALLEAFRAPELHRPFWGGIPQLTWTEILLAGVGAVGFLAGEVRSRRTASHVATAPADGGRLPRFDSSC